MLYAVDTSVAVPLLTQAHTDHASVLRWRSGKQLTLVGHAIAETYSVLTRLPGDDRLSADDAVAAIDRAFPERRGLRPRAWTDLPAMLSRSGIFGGAVYDALVGIAAFNAKLPLATRDARATATYRRLGVTVEIVS